MVTEFESMMMALSPCSSEQTTVGLNTICRIIERVGNEGEYMHSKKVAAVLVLMLCVSLAPLASGTSGRAAPSCSSESGQHLLRKYLLMTGSVSNYHSVC